MSDFTFTYDAPVEEHIETKTIVTGFENGVEQRRSKWSQQKRTFILNFTNNTAAEKAAVQSFFITKLGQATAFTFTNPNDSVEYTVRFADDGFKVTRKNYGVYDFQVKLVQVL